MCVENDMFRSDGIIAVELASNLCKKAIILLYKTMTNVKQLAAGVLENSFFFPLKRR